MNLYKGIDHQQLAHIWYILITTLLFQEVC